jgi:hypothetical protein
MEPVGYFHGQQVRMRYWNAYRFAFAHPNKWNNLLMGGVCMLIPLVGPLVLIGFLCDALAPRPIDDGTGRLLPPPRPPHLPYPDFKFDRFMEYLERGLWPFLVSLVVGLVMVPVGFLVMVPAFLIMAPGVTTGLKVVLGVVTVLLVLAMMVGSLVLTLPFMMRAALLQEFGPAFSWAWAKDFLARTWRETLVAVLFLCATGIPLAIVGYLMCFVGMYPAMALFTFAQWHLDFQLYDLYLSRGGTPVPIKPVRLRPVQAWPGQYPGPGPYAGAPPYPVAASPPPGGYPAVPPQPPPDNRGPTA